MAEYCCNSRYVPQSWLKHEGHPGWQINTIDNILNKSLATSAVAPDLITIHLGTNDCDAKVTPKAMVQRMDSLLAHIMVSFYCEFRLKWPLCQ